MIRVGNLEFLRILTLHPTATIERIFSNERHPTIQIGSPFNNILISNSPYNFWSLHPPCALCIVFSPTGFRFLDEFRSLASSPLQLFFVWFGLVLSVHFVSVDYDVCCIFYFCFKYCVCQLCCFFVCILYCYL